jgi:hypothetical protein
MPTRDPSHGKDLRIGVEECRPPGTITTRRPGCGTLVPALKTTVRQAGARATPPSRMSQPLPGSRVPVVALLSHRVRTHVTAPPREPH